MEFQINRVRINRSRPVVSFAETIENRVDGRIHWKLQRDEQLHVDKHLLVYSTLKKMKRKHLLSV